MSDADRTPTNGQHSDTFAGLEARAALLRSRLGRRVHELRARGRALGDPRREIQRHPLVATGIGAAGGLLIGVGIMVGIHRLATRRARRRAEWARSWIRLLAHPELAARRDGIVSSVLRHALVVATGAASTTLVRHWAEAMFKTPPTRALPAPDPFPSPPRSGRS